MHLHVITTTQSKLEHVLNDWLSDRDTTTYSVHHVGARDWVIVLRHAEHDADDTTASALVQVSDSEFVDSTDAMVWATSFCARFHGGTIARTDRPGDAVIDPGLMVGWFANAMAVVERAATSKTHDTSPVRVEVYGDDVKHFQYEGGPAMPPNVGGLIEDARRTWVLWFGHDGRPKTLWLRRDTTGAVVGDPIVFSDTEPGGPGQVMSIPGWDIDALRETRNWSYRLRSGPGRTYVLERVTAGNETPDDIEKIIQFDIEDVSANRSTLLAMIASVVRGVSDRRVELD